MPKHRLDPDDLRVESLTTDSSMPPAAWMSLVGTVVVVRPRTDEPTEPGYSVGCIPTQELTCVNCVTHPWC